MAEKKKPLDEIIDAIAADPTKTFEFSLDGKVVAVLVNHDQLQKLRALAGCDLEVGLDAVLRRYGVPLHGLRVVRRTRLGALLQLRSKVGLAYAPGQWAQA